MSRKPDFIRDIGNYLVGRGSLILLGFVTFPLLTRVLPVEQYGILSLTFRLVLLLVVLSKCGLQYSAARFYDASKSDVAGQRRFYSTLLIGPTITSLLFSAIYMAVLFSSSELRRDIQLFHCLLLAPVAVVLRTLQSMLLSFLRNEGRSRLHTIVEVMTKVTTMVGLIALALAGQHRAFPVVLATMTAEAIVVAVQLGDVLRRGLIHPTAIDWDLIRTSLKFGMPLIAYELSSLVLDSADRIIVQRYMGDHSLGLYSAAYSISGYLQDVVMTPLNLALFPIYMRLWNEEGKEATSRFLSMSLSWFVVIALFITGLSTLCAGDALVFLASTRFAGAEGLLKVLVPALMVYALHIFFNVGLVLQKRTTLLAIIVVVAAAVNIAANFAWIPRYGLMGAAAATFLSYAVMVGTLIVVNRDILPLHVNPALAISGVVALLCAYPLPTFIHSQLLIAQLLGRAAAYSAIFAGCFFIMSSDFRKAVKKVIAKLPIGTISPLRVPSTAATGEGGAE
ncbi:lipopolysaccharide biosynthesis protein [Terriglobus sp. TAA 43]|uniref:lipopolysaccharide biosynthesis protein n=1 Tax=Terriglobus sp. TAA 43 TaxID=278961 RepID=UPI00064716F2|nr:lipopolysaccharide biosynthesis protein [Terriglobus sp. TAA 43]